MRKAAVLGFAVLAVILVAMAGALLLLKEPKAARVTTE